MMAKFKAGDKVRVLDVDKIGGADAYFKNGDTTHVISVAPGGYPYLYCNDGDYVDGLFITDRECSYLELAEAKPSKNERISLLESQVAELTAKVEALQKRRKPATLLVHSPNESRKAVIERAKAFVAEWESKCGRKVSYVINAEKRTVVALKHRMFFGIVGEVIGRGIAKCAPDDVFNADIGKAIALGRALGLDVSEFENAVKPTEFAKGQVITYDRRKQIITEIDGDKARINKDDFHWTFRINEREYVIIDDTDAKY